MKHLFLISALVVGCASSASAKVYDAANQQYQMSGAINANIVARCGIATFRSPMEFPEQFSIQFGPQIIPVVSGDIVGTFQIKNDNLLSAGEIVDGEIAERKNNKLILKYAGLTQLEGAEKLKNLIQNKALEHGEDLGGTVTISDYSFKAYVRVDSLKFVETIRLSMPNYRRGCSSTLNVKRKLLGSVVAPAV